MIIQDFLLPKIRFFWKSICISSQLFNDIISKHWKHWIISSFVICSWKRGTVHIVKMFTPILIACNKYNITIKNLSNLSLYHFKCYTIPPLLHIDPDCPSWRSFWNDSPFEITILYGPPPFLAFRCKRVVNRENSS